MIKKLPKLRGHGVNRARTVNSSIERFSVVNLNVIESHFDSGDRVSPKELVEKKLVNKKSGKLPKVKILGLGKITKKITVANCNLSESAKTSIEKAGGKVL
jgi:large subunit ribosomal protein L15